MGWRDALMGAGLFAAGVLADELRWSRRRRLESRDREDAAIRAAFTPVRDSLLEINRLLHEGNAPASPAHQQALQKAMAAHEAASSAVLSDPRLRNRRGPEAVAAAVVGYLETDNQDHSQESRIERLNRLLATVEQAAD